MKHLILIISVVITLSSCKKDYACLASETVEYGITADSTSTQSDLKIKHDYQVFEACMNCSNKDKQALLEMMLEQIIREEDQTKIDYEEQGYFVQSEEIQSTELICEEKDL